MKNLTREEEDRICEEFMKKFKFNPQNWYVKKFEQIFDLKNYKHKIYMIDDNNDIVISEKFQFCINNIFDKIFKNETLYAIDWEHGTFEYSPKEIGNVFGDNRDDLPIPSYYPAGDDYFFVSKDFKKGILSIPGFGWTYSLMFVVGEDLIKAFDSVKTQIGLLDYDKTKMDNFEDMTAYKDVEEYADEIKKVQPNASREQLLEIAKSAIDDAKRRNKNKQKNRIPLF